MKRGMETIESFQYSKWILIFTIILASVTFICAFAIGYLNMRKDVVAKEKQKIRDRVSNETSSNVKLGLELDEAQAKLLSQVNSATTEIGKVTESIHKLDSFQTQSLLAARKRREIQDDLALIKAFTTLCLADGSLQMQLNTTDPANMNSAKALITSVYNLMYDQEIYNEVLIKNATVYVGWQKTRQKIKVAVDNFTSYNYHLMEEHILLARDALQPLVGNLIGYLDENNNTFILNGRRPVLTSWGVIE
jgi:hypothetical protein